MLFIQMFLFKFNFSPGGGYGSDDDFKQCIASFKIKWVKCSCKDMTIRQFTYYDFIFIMTSIMFSPSERYVFMFHYFIFAEIFADYGGWRVKELIFIL